MTGKTEEVWISNNLLKVKYTQKEITGSNKTVQGVELTIVYWIRNRNVVNGNSYNNITLQDLSSEYWIGGNNNDAKYDPDYSGLEGNDLNNNYMKKNHHCSDLPEFASLNWLKVNCNGSYDYVLKAMNETETAQLLKNELLIAAPGGGDGPFYVLRKVPESDGSEFNIEYYAEKELKVIGKIGESEYKYKILNIKTHPITNNSVETNEFIFSNCSSAHIVKNGNLTFRYIYKGSARTEGGKGNTDSKDDYTIYTVDTTSGYSSLYSGILNDEYLKNSLTGSSCDLSNNNDEYISFIWLSKNCNRYYLTLHTNDSVSANGIGYLDEKDNEDGIFEAKFALRRYTSKQAHEYKDKNITLDSDSDVKYYTVGLVNTHLYYTVKDLSLLPCFGDQDYSSILPDDGVIGVKPYPIKDNEDLTEIMYLSNTANVYIVKNNNTKIEAKLVRKVVKRSDEKQHTNYVLESDINEDYSGYDCSSDANVNFFKNDGNTTCKCESEFISFRWIRERCEKSIAAAVTKMKDLHTDNTINITKNIINETYHVVSGFNGDTPIIDNNYQITVANVKDVDVKIMIKTHPINDTKVVSITVGGKQGYISDLGLFIINTKDDIISRVKYDVFTRNYDSYSYYEIGKLNEEESGAFITNSLKEELKECSEIPPIYEDVLPYKWMKENCPTKISIIEVISDAELKAIPKRLAIRSYDAVVAHKYGENELNETHIDYKLVLKSEMKEALRYYEESDYSPTPLLENEGGSSSWNDNVNSGSIITLHITSNYSVFTYLNKREATTVKIVIPSEKINQTVGCKEGTLTGSCNKFTWYKMIDNKNPTSNHLVNMIYDYSGYEGEANRIYFKENYKNCPSLPEFASFRWLKINCKESYDKMVDPFISRFVGEMNGIYYSKSFARPHNGTVYLNCKENKGEISECETHPMIVDGLLDVTKAMLIDSSVIPEGNGCKLEEKNLKNEAGDRYDMTSYLSDYMVGKKRVLYNLDGSIKLESTLFCTTSKKSSFDGSYSIYESGTENYVESKIIVNDYVKSLFNKYGCSTTESIVNFEWIYSKCQSIKNEVFEPCSKVEVSVGQKGTGFIALPIGRVEIEKEYETTSTKEITDYIFVNTDKVYTIKSNKALLEEAGFTPGDYLPIPDSQGAIGKWMTEVDLESLSVTKDALVYEYTLLRKPLTVKVVKYVESVNKGSRSTTYITKDVDEEYSGYVNNNANRNYIENVCGLKNLPEFMSFKWIKRYCNEKSNELINRMSSRYSEPKVEIGRLVNSADGANIMINGVADVDKFLHVEDMGTVRNNQMINVIELDENDGIIDRTSTNITFYGKNEITFIEIGKCYQKYTLSRSKSGIRTTLTKGSSRDGSCTNGNNIEGSITVGLRYEGGINAYKVDNNDKIVDSQYTYEVRRLTEIDNEKQMLIETLPTSTPQAQKDGNNNNSEKDHREDKASSIDYIFMILTVLIVMSLI